MKQEKLTPETVAVEERTVSIRVLRVGTRQLTQSLYLQLPVQHIISESDDCGLLGIPWGYLAHNAANCPKDGVPQIAGPHIHVIWEADSTLFRCVLTESIPNAHVIGQKIKELREERQKYLGFMGAARVFEENIPSPTDGNRQLQYASIELPDVRDSYGDSVWTRPIKKVIALWEAQRAVEAQALWDSSLRTPDRTEKLAALQQNIEQARAELGMWLAGNTYTSLLHGVRQIEASIADYETHWKATYQRVAASGQLFIGA